jgi:hypothetical protein
MAIVNQMTKISQTTPNLFQADWKNSTTNCGDQNILVNDYKDQKLAFEFFRQCSKKFSHLSRNCKHLMNHGLISTIDLIIEFLKNFAQKNRSLFENIRLPWDCGDQKLFGKVVYDN